VEPGAPTRRRRRGPLIATLIVVAVVVATILWVEAPVLWPPKPGHSVTLLGIDRTLTYNGSRTGYVDGTITSGCPACPLVIQAGTTVAVNASWIGASPWTPGLHFVFVNWTIRSPFPFLALSGHPGDQSSVYSWTDGDEFGEPGGWTGIWLNLSIPLDSSGLPATGTIQVWYNASAI